MTSTGPNPRRARGKLGAHLRWHPGDESTAAELRQQFRAEQIEAAAQQVAADLAAEPLTPAQRARIAGILGHVIDVELEVRTDPGEPTVRGVRLTVGSDGQLGCDVDTGSEPQRGRLTALHPPVAEPGDAA